MQQNVIVWDIETVPDLRGFAAANGLDGKADDEIRAQAPRDHIGAAELGDKFPKPHHGRDIVSDEELADALLVFELREPRAMPCPDSLFLDARHLVLCS
jgi:hypothetical protein